MYIDITDIIEMTWVTLPWDGRLYELCWLLYKRCDHGSSDAVSFRFGQSLTWKKTLSFVLKPSTVMISNQFPVLFFKGLFWKRMQDVVEPTRFICFPLLFHFVQGNYNWTRARSGSFEHPNFGYRMREVPIFGGTSIPPNGRDPLNTSRIVRGRVKWFGTIGSV